MSEQYRDTCCSFCRKSYRDVGPLVEGPGDVYICGQCAELCQEVIKQEKRRRGWSPRKEALSAEELSAFVHRIQSREALSVFVLVLLDNLRNRPDQWEHRELASYLDAMAAWVGSMDAYYQNRGEPVPDQPTWKTLGEILLAAKVYE